MRPIILKDSQFKMVKTCLEKIAGPQQRLIMGVTAIASQPFIDYYNSNVDERTRKYSTCRTIAKIVAGTTVGVVVRAIAIKYSAKYIKHVDVSKIATDVLRNAKDRAILQKTIGDILGIGACLITNFLLDVPLTKAGTNFLAKQFKIDDPKKERTK